MKTKHRAAAALLAVMMVLSLSACQKKPTSESLLAGLKDIDMEKYTDMSMTLEARAESDGQDISLKMETGLEAAKDVMHLYDMSVEVAASGFSMTIGAEMWADDEMTYMNMSMMGEETGWVASASEGTEDVIDSLSIKDLADDAESAVLQEHKKGEDYVVTWELDAKDAGDELDGMMGSFNDMMELEDSEVSSMTVEVRFDEKTEAVKSFGVSCDLASEGELGSVAVTITLNTVNGDKELEIPDDVIASAVPEEDEGEDFTFGDDDRDNGDEESYVSDDGRLEINGMANDDVIASLSERIQTADPDYDGLYVNYDEDGEYASLAYYTGGSSDWSNDLHVEHLRKGYYETAMEQFEYELGFCIEWYEAEPVMGSLEDGYAVFLDTSNDWTEAMYIAVDGDLYIAVEVDCFADEIQELSACVDQINEMLFVGGFQQISGSLPAAA